MVLIYQRFKPSIFLHLRGLHVHTSPHTQLQSWVCWACVQAKWFFLSSFFIVCVHVVREQDEFKNKVSYVQNTETQCRHLLLFSSVSNTHFDQNTGFSFYSTLQKETQRGLPWEQFIYLAYYIVIFGCCFLLHLYSTTRMPGHRDAL